MGRCSASRAFLSKNNQTQPCVFLFVSFCFLVFGYFILFYFILPMDVQFLQHNLLERLSSIELLIHLLQETVGHICVGVFLISLFCSIHLYIYPTSNSFGYCSDIVSLDIG